MPTHYEPVESPVANLLHDQQDNPARRADRPGLEPASTPRRARSIRTSFITYRLTEHHTAGGMSRTLPYLSELQPEFFCEVSPALAARAGPRAPGVGDADLGAHRDRGPGAGDRADEAAADRGPDRAPDRPALPLGRRTGCRPATPRTTCSAWSWTRTSTSRSRRWRPATSSPAGVRAGRRCSSSSSSTAARPGSSREERVTTVETKRRGGRAPMTNVLRRVLRERRLAVRAAPRPGRRRRVRQADHPKRVGFFTDTSVCIGCKACEVACKEWNLVPDDGTDASDLYRLTGMSYDNTGDLGASTWRHVAFIEDVAAAPDGDARARRAGRARGMTTGHLPPGCPRWRARRRRPPATPRPRRPTRRHRRRDRSTCSRCCPTSGAHGQQTPDDERDVRWLMSSDVCKHCTHAGCLDNCPTGALFRTEFGTVVVQDDICNGCGYCVPSCPYGVIDVREADGGAHKCTLCYDRLGSGMEPACAKACPTNSIQFGDLDELQATADARLAELHGRGVERGAALRPRPERRRRRRRRLLPAARRARGLRAAAGPDRHHARPARDVAERRADRRRPRGGRGGDVLEGAAMTKETKRSGARP